MLQLDEKDRINFECITKALELNYFYEVINIK